MFQHSPWWSAPPWTAAPHQQRPGWVTWTWGRSQTEPRTHASAPQALTPRSNPGSAALARAAARRSRLKDRGGLCCYYQPYTATLAAGGNESRRCLSVRADRGEGDETHVWKKSRRSNAIVWLLIPFRLIKRVLRSHISACWRDSHQNTAQHNTAQTANTHQAVFGEGANGKLCTPGWVVVVVGGGYTSTTALLFIAVSLPYLTEADRHACFLRLNTMTAASNAGVTVMLSGQKTVKGGTFQGGGVNTTDAPSSSWQHRYQGQWGGKGWTWYQFTMLLIDHHVQCFNGRLRVWRMAQRYWHPWLFGNM